MKAFILAGGFATRLWPLTEKRAKPLLPLAGKPLIDHLIDQLPQEIPVTVSINAAFAQSFAEWKANRRILSAERDRVDIVIEESRKDTEKLGALGAVAQWITKNKRNSATSLPLKRERPIEDPERSRRSEGNDDILLLTGDNYCGFSIPAFIQSAASDVPLLAAHDIGDLKRASAFGTVVPAADGVSIQAFEEKPKTPKSTLVSTGVSVIPARHLPVLVEFAKAHPDNVGGIFEEFLRRGVPVEFRAYSEPWFDIGSFEAYLEATRAIVGERALTGEGVTCTQTKTSGSVVLGNRSSVQNSVLENVILFENCTVEDCVLSDCILDNGCSLKGIDLSGQMLREGTVLRRELEK